MNDNRTSTRQNPHINKKKLLKEQIKKILPANGLDEHRRLIKAVSSELKMSVLDCAAALVLLQQNQLFDAGNTEPSGTMQVASARLLPSPIRLVRYRLSVGNQHQIELGGLKKLLVEESGVDINNIANVRIQDDFTLIDLPDEMPQEIFHHLKSVEINGQKLDIRRVKPRKKWNNRRRKPQADSANHGSPEYNR